MTAVQDKLWMREALVLAHEAKLKGEVPVGCIIVHEGRIIGRGYNLRENSQDPTMHAELIALREAAQALDSWRLLNTTLYVTLEPCPMCAGAITLSRVPRLVYGCDDPKAGAVRSLYQITNDQRLNHRCEVKPGVLADESSYLLSAFFSKLRSAHQTLRIDRLEASAG